MKIKINGKPIRVRDQRENSINKYFLVVYGLTGLLIFALLDHMGFIFMGYHPFPFMKIVEEFLKWLG